jgi:hypothetical protein
MNGTWLRSRREREAQVCGAHIAQGSSRVAWSKKKKFAESQIQIGTNIHLWSGISGRH